MPRVLVPYLVVVLAMQAAALPDSARPVDASGEARPLPSQSLRPPLERKPVLPPPEAPSLPARAERDTRPDLPPVLQRLASSEDPALRQRAVEGVAAMPAKVAAGLLLRLAGDPDPTVQSAALDALQPLDTALVAEELLLILESPEGWPLLEGDGNLQVLGPQLGDAILDVFVSPTAEAPRRILAAYCLGQMRHGPAVQPLRDAMWTDDSEVAYACLDALYWLDDPRMLEDWLRLAENSDPWVQAYAAAALARSGAQESLETLHALASGQLRSSPQVQRQALEGIAAWPGSVSIPYLINILRANQSMQPATIDALRKASGIDVGRYPTSWYEWYREESEAAATAADQASTPPPLMPDLGDNQLLGTVDFVPPGFAPE